MSKHDDRDVWELVWATVLIAGLTLLLAWFFLSAAPEIIDMLWEVY